MDDAVSMSAALMKKAVRSNTSFRGALVVGADLALPVHCWRKVVPASAPTMKSVAKAALEHETDETADPSSSVQREARTFASSAPDQDVAPHLSVPGHRFGKDLVPVAGADLERIKFGVEAKSLQLIGFVPQASVPRHLLHGRAE